MSIDGTRGAIALTVAICLLGAGHELGFASQARAEIVDPEHIAEFEEFSNLVNFSFGLASEQIDAQAEVLRTAFGPLGVVIGGDFETGDPTLPAQQAFTDAGYEETWRYIHGTPRRPRPTQGIDVMWAKTSDFDIVASDYGEVAVGTGNGFVIEASDHEPLYADLSQNGGASFKAGTLNLRIAGGPGFESIGRWDLFNWHETRKDLVLETINDANPDIMGFQEAFARASPLLGAAVTQQKSLEDLFDGTKYEFLSWGDSNEFNMNPIIYNTERFSFVEAGTTTINFEDLLGTTDWERYVELHTLFHGELNEDTGELETHFLSPERYVNWVVLLDLETGEQVAFLTSHYETFIGNNGYLGAGAAESVAPEPSSLVLALLGVMGAAFFTRRRRPSAKGSTN